MGTDVLVRVCVAQQMLWAEEVLNEAGVKQALAAMRDKSRPQVAKLQPW